MSEKKLTVAELIAILNTLPQDTKVMLTGEISDYPLYESEINHYPKMNEVIFGENY